MRLTLGVKRLGIMDAKPTAHFALILLILLAFPRPGHAGEALTLEQCIRLALQHNPTFAGERAALREAQASYLVARAGLLPKLSVSAYYNRLNADRLSPLGTAATPSALYTSDAFAGLTVSQLIFDGGHARAGTRAAAHGVAAGRAGVAASRAETVYQVTKAYFGVLEAKALTEVAQEATRRQRDFEQLTSEFFRAGKVTRLDVIRARAQTLDAERTQINAVEVERLAGAVLQEAIGLDARGPIAVAGTLPAHVEPPLPEADLMRAAAADNPDLRSAGQLVHQARENVRAARGVSYPALSLQGGYGREDRNVGGEAPLWTAGVFVNWPIFEGGAIRAGVDAADARLTQIEQARRALQIAVQVQVDQALAAWRTAIADVRAARSLVATDREAVHTAVGLYRAGMATALDVLTAQTDLTAAEGSEVQALTAYTAARAQMARVTGPVDITHQEPRP